MIGVMAQGGMWGVHFVQSRSKAMNSLKGQEFELG
jgi:hypothetical protein